MNYKTYVVANHFTGEVFEYSGRSLRHAKRRTLRAALYGAAKGSYIFRFQRGICHMYYKYGKNFPPLS